MQKKSGSRRLLKLEFAKDGSIYVFFPGFKNTKGIVANAHLAPGTNQLKVSDYGFATKYLVKFAHHPSGHAHFSLTGKIKTLVTKEARPLNQEHRHFFTFHAQGLEGFEIPRKPLQPSNLLINVEDTFNALKLTCFRYKLNHLSTQDKAPMPPNKPTNITFPNNEIKHGFLVAPPSDFPYAEYALFLVPQHEVIDMRPNEPFFVFLGAFDDPKIVKDYSRETSFLTLLYPCENYQDLLDTVGSVDLV